MKRNVELHVNGEGSPRFVIKGKISNRQFSTMIGMGSPITMFTAGDLRKVIQQDVKLARTLPKIEEYVDYNCRPLNLFGFITADVKLGKQTLN